jgi:hypothetical protein
MAETIPVTVCIPTLGSRRELLKRAVASVEAQTLKPERVLTREDTEGLGSAHNRHALLQMVETEWVAFLDDDDEFLPDHLETLWNNKGDADFVYSWYEVGGGSDPWNSHFGRPYEPGVTTTITVMVRTALAKRVGFLRGEATSQEVLSRARENRLRGGPGRKSSCDDHSFNRGIYELGGKIVHIPQKTWIWHHHPGNTGGLPGIAN